MTNKKLDSLKIWNYIFLIVLLLYPLRHIWLGVELTDSAYSAGNYRFSEQINGMWFFSTFLANVTGKFLSGLPFGNTLMGLNAYTALFISAVAVAMYLFFTKIVKISPVIAFLGEMLAISLCWCPTTILYNYMTYFFFNMAIIVLYMGLVREKRWLMFLAGILLGMNVLVRFPNLAEAALIVTLWYYGFLQRKRIKDIFQETGICILGYLTGIGVILIGIVWKYGIDEYVTGIINLMNMPSDASDYSLYSMVLTVLMDYKSSSRWLICMLLLSVVGCGISVFANWILQKKEESKGKSLLGLVGKLAFVGGILLMLRWWYSLGVFNIRYYTYESMFQWVAVFLIITILICVYFILSRREEITRNQRLLAGMVLVLVGVTPLGSNNHLYPNMNNMFVVFPFALSVLWEFFDTMLWFDTWEFSVYRKKTEKETRFQICTFPVKAMLSVFVLAVIFQTLMFGAVFTFRDGMSGQKRDTKIENNAILKGMVTNQELATAIEELTLYIEQENLTDKELILYGQIPATSYILDMPSAISTTWPDLRSYGYGTMVADMEQIRLSIDAAVTESGIAKVQAETPLIIIGAGLDGFFRDDEEAMNAAELTEGEKAAYEVDAKWKLITDFMNQYNYTRKFGNAKFAVYQASAEE